MTRAPRRTPVQIALEELGVTERKLKRINERIDRLDNERKEATKERDQLVALVDYQRQNPLLAETLAEAEAVADAIENGTPLPVAHLDDEEPTNPAA